MLQVCPKCKGLVEDGEKCPKCGFDASQSGTITTVSEPSFDLFGSSDDVLKQGILKSIKDLERQEAGTGWGKLAVILQGNTADWMMVQLLKAIIDQNKIIIRQNELLLRAAKSVR